MSTNDPIDKILAKAAAFEKLANAPAKPLSPKLMAEVNAIFSKPVSTPESNASKIVVTRTELTSLLLMVIDQQSVSTVEALEALKTQNVVFDGGHALVFEILQKLELQGYLKSVQKLRRGRTLKVYTITVEGRTLVGETESDARTLNSLAVRIAAGIAVA